MNARHERPKTKLHTVVTHPFHPLRGQRLAIVARQGRQVRCGDREHGYRILPVQWTDLAPPDAFLSASGGRSLLRPERLLELADLLDGLGAK